MLAIAVALPRPRIGQIAVPHLIGALGEANRRRLVRVTFIAKEAEVHRARVLGEEREVHANAIPGCAQRIRPAWPDAHRHSVLPSPSSLKAQKSARRERTAS